MGIPYRFIKSIRGKLTLLLLTMFLPLLLAQAFYHFDRFETRRENEFQAHLEVARAAALAFDGFVQDILREELAVGTHLTFPQSLSLDQMNQVLSQAANEYPAVRNFSWVSPQGSIIASSIDLNLGVDVSDRPYIKEVLSGKEWVLDNLLLSRTTGKPLFAISRGIRDRQGNLLGIMLAAVIPERLADVLSVDRALEGAITLIDRNGRAVFRHPAIAWDWEEQSGLKDHSVVRRALGGEEITATIPGFFDGKKRMTALTPSSLTGWIVSASRPEREAMASVRRELFQQASLLLLLTAALFLAAWALSHTIIRSIKRLQDHASKLGGGALNLRVDTKGPSELRDLAAAFNAMAEEIEKRQEALEAARLRLFSVLEAMPAIVYLQAPDHSIRFANRNFRETFGELEGKPCYEMLRARKEPCEGCTVSCTFLEQSSQEWEWTHPNGRTYVTYNRPFWDIDGSPLVLKVAVDITERQQVEEALRESEEKFRIIAETIEDVFWIATPGLAQIVYINPAYESLWKRSRQSLYENPLSFTEVVHPEDRERILAEVEQFKKRELFDSEFRIIQPDGSIRWIYSRAFPTTDVKEPFGLMTGVATDITKRKEAEEALRSALETSRKRESEVSALLDATRAVLTYRDLEKSARSIFETCKKLIGAAAGYVALISEADETKNEVLLLDPGGLLCSVDPNRPMSIRGLHKEAYQTGRAVYHNDFARSDRLSLMPEGHAPIENVMFAPLMLQGKVVGLIGLANKPGGFTEEDARMASAFGEIASIALLNSQAFNALQVSERDLRHLSARLLSAQEEERKKVAREIHDSIGSSLSAIKLSLESARHRLEAGSAAVDALEIPIRWTQHAIEEARRLMMDLRPSILDDLGLIATIDWFCNQFQTVYSNIFIEKMIEMKEEEIPSPLKIVIFRMLQEAFHNIAKHSRAELVELSLAQKNGVIGFTIEDNGIGFAADAHHGKGSHSQGLGISSMRERAELSGGSFSIESVVGHGTTVFASWPFQV